MYRFTFIKILFAQLLFSTEEQDKEEFRLRFNECAHAWNDLCEEANQNLWSIKKAAKVEAGADSEEYRAEETGTVGFCGERPWPP